MKAFFNNLIPKFQKYSENLDNLTFLTNHHWVSLNELDNSKTVYIFRGHNILLISKDGMVSKGSWEYLGNESILFETGSQTQLLKHFFVDEDILMLKLDGSEGYISFVNETKYGMEINTYSDVLKFLEKKYETPKAVPYEEPIAIDDHVVPGFKEFSPKKTVSVLLGGFDRIHIIFDNGYEGDINMGHISGKYFYYDIYSGKIYAKDKLDCISILYKQLRHFK